MFRIDTDTAVGTQPAQSPAGTPGFFANAIPGVSSATVLDQDFFNNIQEELISLLSLGDGQGVTPTTPDKATQDQIKTHMELWLATLGGGGGASVIDVTQAGHGFAKYDVIRHNGTIYTKAQADAIGNSEVVGIVSEVTDTDNFTLTVGGVIEWNVAGVPDYTLGASLWLSQGSSGVIVTTEPTSGVVQFLGYSAPEGLVAEINKASNVSIGSFPWLRSNTISKTGNYTVLIADEGKKHILTTGASADATFTLPTASLVGGMTFSFANQNAFATYRLIINDGTDNIAFIGKADGVLTLSWDADNSQWV